MTIQRMMSVYFPTAAFIFCFEGFKGSHAALFHAVTGLPALIAACLLFFSEKLWRYRDVQLLAAITIWSWISAAISFGPSLYFFLSIHFTHWMFLLSMYFIIRSSTNPNPLLDRYASTRSAGLSGACLIVLIHAVLSIRTSDLGHDRILGCFQLGRLCGMSNANSLGRYCTALILISAFALLRTSGKLRIPFAVSQLIGWFCLGLANSRSAIICIAFFAALMTLFTVHDKILNRNASLSLKAVLIIAASAVLVFVLVISLFYIPTPLFRNVISSFAGVTGNTELFSNVSVPTVRNMTTDLATMEDRILIWERCLQDVFSTPRRTWLGVSDQNIDKITGVYPGHHEILTVNAHNMFLELLMRQGLIGLSIWLVLIVLWCTAGIRILFDPEEPLHIRCLAAAAAAILINGLAEAVPFSSTTGSGLSTPFFVICAYCMNNRRSKE